MGLSTPVCQGVRRRPQASAALGGAARTDGVSSHPGQYPRVRADRHTSCWTPTTRGRGPSSSKKINQVLQSAAFGSGSSPQLYMATWAKFAKAVDTSLRPPMPPPTTTNSVSTLW